MDFSAIVQQLFIIKKHSIERYQFIDLEKSMKRKDRCQMTVTVRNTGNILLQRMGFFFDEKKKQKF